MAGRVVLLREWEIFSEYEGMEGIVSHPGGAVDASGKVVYSLPCLTVFSGMGARWAVSLLGTVYWLGPISTAANQQLEKSASSSQ